MELVPILSTIILVGTIATFILAVAAYILYKIRERKAREAPARTEQRRPEPHVLVQQQQQQPQVQVIAGQPAPASIYAPADRPAARIPAAATASPPASMFWEYTDEGFVPVSPQQQAAPQQARREQQRDDEGFAWL